MFVHIILICLYSFHCCKIQFFYIFSFESELIYISHWYVCSIYCKIFPVKDTILFVLISSAFSMFRLSNTSYILNISLNFWFLSANSRRKTVTLCNSVDTRPFWNVFTSSCPCLFDLITSVRPVEFLLNSVPD